MSGFRTRPTEEGASATVFILSLFALLGLALLAIDGGFLLVSRRGQVADTDSAALAAARALAADACLPQAAVNDTADRLLRLNDPLLDSTSTSRVGDVEVDPSTACPESGVVTVTSQRPSAMFFAPLFGFNDLKTSVSSRVAWGEGNYFEGLRPIGICSLDPHYIEWETFYQDLDSTTLRDAYLSNWTLDPEGHPSQNTSGADYTTSPYAAGTSNVHRIRYQKLDDTSYCGGSPGNFGWLDFDGTGNSLGCDDDMFKDELRCRLMQGYEGGVHLGDSVTAKDCNSEDVDPATPCWPEPGQIDAATAALDQLICPAGTAAKDCTPLMIVVYNSATPPPNSSFGLESVAVVVIRDFNLKSKGKDIGQNFLDIEFTDIVTTGEIVSSGSTVSGTAPKVVQACGTESFDNC